jgi:hypothetical protein
MSGAVRTIPSPATTTTRSGRSWACNGPGITESTQKRKAKNRPAENIRIMIAPYLFGIHQELLNLQFLYRFCGKKRRTKKARMSWILTLTPAGLDSCSLSTVPRGGMNGLFLPTVQGLARHLLSLPFPDSQSLSTRR